MICYLGLFKRLISACTIYCVARWTDSTILPGIISTRIFCPEMTASSILKSRTSSPLSNTKHPILDFLKLPWKFVSASTSPRVHRVNRKLTVFQGKWRTETSLSWNKYIYIKILLTFANCSIYFSKFVTITFKLKSKWNILFWNTNVMRKKYNFLSVIC